MAEKVDLTKMFENAEIKPIPNRQAELLPCPFCGGEAVIRVNMGREYICPIHKRSCVIKPDTWLQEEIISELRSASEWFTEHGRNTNTAIIGICNRAINLINRQKAEIEELESEIDKQYEQAKADILGNMADGGTSCHWCIEQHEAKAIKEFAERLKEKAIVGRTCDDSKFESVVTVSNIDAVAKEFEKEGDN